MKLFLQPSQSSLHRIACIALYRALLEQCPRVQHLAEGWPAAPLTFKHLIRKQFRRNQHVQSSRLIVSALKAGYEAEELLRLAGDGDVTAKSKVMTVLHEIESTRALSRANAANGPDDPKPKKRRLPAPYPGAKPILESRPRPREELGGSGIRKAPVYICASNFPMLRFSKNHSPFLSRVIRDKQLRLEKIHSRREAHEPLLKVAREEDMWDSIIQEACWEEGKRDLVEGDGSSWCAVLGMQMQMDRKALTVEVKRNREVAKKMLDIVSQEESLVARERMERRRATRREKMGMQLDDDHAERDTLK